VQATKLEILKGPFLGRKQKAMSFSTSSNTNKVRGFASELCQYLRGKSEGVVHQG
jgi:hypothetical protein